MLHHHCPCTDGSRPQCRTHRAGEKASLPGLQDRNYPCHIVGHGSEFFLQEPMTMGGCSGDPRAVIPLNPRPLVCTFALESCRPTIQEEQMHRSISPLRASSHMLSYKVKGNGYPSAAVKHGHLYVVVDKIGTFRLSTSGTSV